MGREVKKGMYQILGNTQHANVLLISVDIV